ncbi:MAG: cell division protein FtsQ/DivIB [Actinomycetes bacterium]
MVKKHIKKRLQFLFIFLLAITATIIYIGWYSTLLTVKKIEVRGNQVVSQDSILELAQVAPNIQLLRLNVSQTSQRIKTISQIKSVDVRRGWPETLVIEVVERTPLAVTDIPEGRYLIDESGVAYQPVTPDANLPLIFGSDDQNRAIGIKAWQSFPTWLQAEVVSTTVDNPNSIWFLLTSGRRVDWGNLDKANEKAAVLKVLRRMAASTYDVATPEVPVVKP